MLAASKWKDFAARKAEAAGRGKLRGIGLSCYIEACGVAPSSAVGGALGCGVGMWEMAEIKVNPVGTVEVFVGTLGHGQGHETTYAQIVADRFGIPDRVGLRHRRRYRQGPAGDGQLRLAVGRKRHGCRRQGP